MSTKLTVAQAIIAVQMEVLMSGGMSKSEVAHLMSLGMLSKFGKHKVDVDEYVKASVSVLDGTKEWFEVPPNVTETEDGRWQIAQPWQADEGSNVEG